MALTVEQVRRRDRQRRDAAVPPAPDPAPAVSVSPAAVYLSKNRPTGVAAGSVWIPVDDAGAPAPMTAWEVFT